jgi:hypothetical protein
MSARIFLSYAHEDGETTARLAEELRARGFRTWQDVEDIRLGNRIESEVERGIAKCEAILHVLTPASISSPAVRREITLALARRRRDPEFAVLAAARDLGEGHEDVGRVTFEHFGENFARDWLELLEPGPDPITHEEAAALARKVLRGFYPREEGPPGGQWQIALHTRAMAAAEADLDLDWRALLGDEVRTPGDFESWGRAWRAVRDVRDILAEHSRRRSIRLEAAAHQTAGLLFGLAFCANGGYRLEIADQHGELWRRAEDAGSAAGFRLSLQPESLEGTYLTVELEVVREVLGAVGEHLAGRGEEPRARLLVSRDGAPDRVDPATGAALAAGIAGELKRAVDDLGVRRVELYPAAPLALSVLFGSELGALHAELVPFEFQAGYTPSLSIPEEER